MNVVECNGRCRKGAIDPDCPKHGRQDLVVCELCGRSVDPECACLDEDEAA